MRRIARLARAALLAAIAALPAAAVVTTPAAAQTGGDWRFQITPYVWGVGLGGDLSLGGFTVEIDKSFSDVLRDLDGAFFISGFARRDRLVFMGDLSWSSSSRSGVLPAPAPGLPAQGRVRQTSLTLAGGYRVAATPGATIDLLAGLRHWRLNASASAPAVPEVGFPGFAASRSASFTDPIVGARLNVELAPGWSTLLYADMGGAGVGSRFTGQLLATVNYQLSEQAWISAGYRHLVVDYRGSGGFRADMRMSGPLIGATWQF